MKRKKKMFCCFLALVMLLSVFNAGSLRVEAFSKNSKVYRLAMKERKKFKQEAEYYGWVIRKEKLLSATKKKVRWSYDCVSCDPNITRPDNVTLYHTHIYQCTMKLDKTYGGAYGTAYDSYEPIKNYDDGLSRQWAIEFLKNYSSSFAIKQALIRKSANGAKSLAKNIKAKNGTVSETTTKYVKSDKTGQTVFTATNSKGKKQKIVVKCFRKKKKIKERLYGKSTFHFIKTKYYLNGKASTKEKILKKF